jgi:hypothetical protein
MSTLAATVVGYDTSKKEAVRAYIILPSEAKKLVQIENQARKVCDGIGIQFQGLYDVFVVGNKPFEDVLGRESYFSINSLERAKIKLSKIKSKRIQYSGIRLIRAMYYYDDPQSGFSFIVQTRIKDKNRIGVENLLNSTLFRNRILGAYSDLSNPKFLKYIGIENCLKSYEYIEKRIFSLESRKLTISQTKRIVRSSTELNRKLKEIIKVTRGR